MKPNNNRLKDRRGRCVGLNSTHVIHGGIPLSNADILNSKRNKSQSFVKGTKA